FLLAFIISDVVKKNSISNITKNTASSVAGLIVGYFAYSYFIAKRLVTGSYNIEHSKIIEINSSLFEGIISNVLSFYRMFSTILNGDNYLIYYSLFFALIISLIVIVLKAIKRDENKKTKLLLVVFNFISINVLHHWTNDFSKITNIRTEGIDWYGWLYVFLLPMRILCF
ncbi:O-antigen conversion protein, partial [Salmonella enterica subsp. enterica serovar Heidelberg str. 41573]